MRSDTWTGRPPHIDSQWYYRLVSLLLKNKILLDLIIYKSSSSAAWGDIGRGRERESCMVDVATRHPTPPRRTSHRHSSGAWTWGMERLESLPQASGCSAKYGLRSIAEHRSVQSSKTNRTGTGTGTDCRHLIRRRNRHAYTRRRSRLMTDALLFQYSAHLDVIRHHCSSSSSNLHTSTYCIGVCRLVCDPKDPSAAGVCGCGLSPRWPVGARGKIHELMMCVSFPWSEASE